MRLKDVDKEDVKKEEMKEEDFSAEFFMEMFYLDDEGILRWKKKPGRSVKAGSEAGTTQNTTGYKEVTYKGRYIGVNRIKWILCNKRLPPPDCFVMNDLSLKRVNDNSKIIDTIVVLNNPKRKADEAECKCTVCGNVWKTTLQSLRAGSGCPDCAKKEAVKKNTLTDSEQKAILKNIHPTIDITETIFSNDQPVWCTCSVCGWGWETRPYTLKRSSGCPKCSGKPRWSEETLRKELDRIFAGKFDFSDLTYVNNKMKVQGFCSEHGYFSRRVQELLHGFGCQECTERGFHPKTKDSILYIITDDLYTPCVAKVGVTTNLKGRLAALSRSTPYQIYVFELFTFKAGIDSRIIEKDIHNVFSDCNIKFTVNGRFDGSTEWFTCGNLLLDYVKAACYNTSTKNNEGCKYENRRH